MADPSPEDNWSCETAVEFDPPSPVDAAALLFLQHDTCRCSQSFGDVVVRPLHDQFSFSFTVQGYNRDFLLFPGAPNAEADYFANFACWDQRCIVLPRRGTYTVTCRDGWLSFAFAAQRSKLDPRTQPIAKKPRLALPKNCSAMQQLPETMAAPVKPHIRMTGDHLTFRVWCGAVLKVNPCRLREGVAERRDWIRLNLRGTLFDTRRQSLLKDEGTFFAALLGNDVWEPNEKGQYEIDRDPQYFPHILTYLCSGQLDIWTLTDDEIRELQEEMDYYSITSQCHFEHIANDATAVHLSPTRTSVKCVLCTGDVRLVLPRGVQSGSLLLSFTVAGNNSDFMLYSGDDFSQDAFFANFYVAHPKVIPIPALHRYVVRIAGGQVSFVRIGNPPPDDRPAMYARKVTKPISDATMRLKGEALYFRLWSGVQITMVNV